MRPLIAGNWKMNGLTSALVEIELVVAGLAINPVAADVLICPAFTLIDKCVSKARHTDLQIGAQDCHPEASGAHTGDVSAPMLADLGATFIIVGHSERRQNHNESSMQVAQKAKAAHMNGLTPIICIGETEFERDAGQVLDVVLKQLRDSVALVPAPHFAVAYEPVWAIGTGRTPTLADVNEVHAAVRQALVTIDAEYGMKVRLLYGGSVKPDNAAELLSQPNVNGALVGGASLKATDFLKIIRAA